MVYAHLHPVTMLAFFQSTQLNLFERFLTQARSGIDSTGITAGMQNVAYVVLLVGFLWQVYQSALHGGDVRGLGTNLIKYIATAVIVMNYGAVYNVLRKEVGFLSDETGNGFEEKMAIEDFRGLFSGETVTREMFEECQLVNSIYGDIASRIVQREEEVKQQLKDAQAQWEVVRQSDDKDKKRAAVLARNKAQAALWEHEQEARDQFSSLHLFVHYWAQGKEENRRAWAQAMNSVVTGGSGSGAVLFQSFPQEVVDAFAEVTGGDRVRVRLPKTVNGYAWFDDEQRAFLVERRANPEGPDCEKRVFLFQYKGKRSLVFENTSVPASLERS